jgi:cellulose synthase/poly-beta-1,6-N-acetylglucosamine synthase-like glycosyltransferase
VISDVVVTIPAADEEDDIDACLQSVERAISELHDRTSARGHVVVALDDCHDGTADIVAGFARVVTVTCTARRVGGARRRAADEALARWCPEQTCLVSTDADCRVPVDWLVEMTALFERGTDVVLGTVRPAPGLTPSVEHGWYDAHSLHDGHTHVHGANMGITGSAYRRIGGWADLAAHEDVDLVQRAVEARLRVARSGAAPVVTSSRLVGRVPEGFASFLRALHEGLPAVS